MFVGAALVVTVLGAMALGGCSGEGPTSDGLHDGADTSTAVSGSASKDDTAAPAASAPLPQAPPAAAECATPDQGCPCDQPGEVVACHGPVLRDGNYTTCDGLRACVKGAWGPCIPPTFHSHGHTGH